MRSKIYRFLYKILIYIITKLFFKVFIIFLLLNSLYASFFLDISYLIENNTPRLSYGVAVTDIDNDERFDFLVTGYRYPNLALSYKNNKLQNIIDDKIFSD